MPSYYIVLEKKIPNLDVDVNGNALSKDSDSLEKAGKKDWGAILAEFF